MSILLLRHYIDISFAFQEARDYFCMYEIYSLDANLSILCWLIAYHGSPFYTKRTILGIRYVDVSSGSGCFA
jgi:hypothetical protein